MSQHLINIIWDWYVIWNFVYHYPLTAIMGMSINGATPSKNTYYLIILGLVGVQHDHHQQENSNFAHSHTWFFQNGHGQNGAAPPIFIKIKIHLIKDLVKKAGISTSLPPNI